MLIRQYTLEQTPGYPLEREYDISKTAFFDIETTGFAPESSYLYLIGCACYKEGSFCLIQWFSEGIREEAELITAFFEFIRDYQVLIHYNGSGFDLPYLIKKCALLGLDCSFDHMNSIDLYKKIYPYRRIFPLKSFSQKSIEAFLSVSRTDTFGGGELIEVYRDYLGKKKLESLRRKRRQDMVSPMSGEIPDTPSGASPMSGKVLDTPSEAEPLLQQLLLHNADDVRGLLSICPILGYADLFEKPIRILQAVVEEGRLLIHFELSSDLPVRVSFGNDLAQATAYGIQASLSVLIYEGELKHFYDNYKDYYYLPAEDSVVHKSVAQYVGKEHRVKARPANCYTRRNGLFAPQYEQVITPCFKQDYRSKLSFLEIHTDFLLQEKNLELYVKHMLRHVF